MANLSVNPTGKAQGQSRLAGAAVPSGQVSLTPKEILGILRRRMWMIIIITTLFTMLSVGLWVIFKRFSPIYTAKGYIQVSMPLDPKIGARMTRKEIIDIEAESAAMRINNDAFYADLLARDKVKKSKWLGNDAMPRYKKLIALQDNLRASALRNTNLVMVTMSAPSGQESKDLVQEALRLFQLIQQQNTSGVYKMSRAALVSRRTNVQNTIKTLQEKKAGLSRQVGEADWLSGRSSVNQQVMLYQQKVLQLEEELQSVLTYQATTVKDKEKFGGYSTTVLEQVEGDPMILQFENQISMLKRQKDNLLNKFGEHYVPVENISAMLESIQTQLLERKRMLGSRYDLSERLMVENTISEIDTKIDTYNSEIITLKIKIADIEQKLADYQNYEKDEITARRQLDVILREMDNISTVLSNSTSASTTISSRIEVPLEMDFPKLTIFLPGGFIFGLFISIGLVFLLEFMDDAVRNPADVRRHLHTPVLGMVPEMDEDDPQQIALITSRQPGSIVSEAFRKIKMSLLFSAHVDDLKTIVVASNSAHGGTTTVVSNLAITFANAGQRVLLVDANFHQPRIKSIFGGNIENKGLSNILVGQIQSAEATYSSDIEGLDILESGTCPPNPIHLFHGKHMQTFLKDVKARYDYILFDAPPSLVVSDARVLGGLVDGTMLVVHAANTSRGIAQRMVNEFKIARIPILGVLLNAVQELKSGYFREASESYYEYVGDSKPAALATNEIS